MLRIGVSIFNDSIKYRQYCEVLFNIMFKYVDILADINMSYLDNNRRCILYYCHFDDESSKSTDFLRELHGAKNNKSIQCYISEICCDEQVIFRNKAACVKTKKRKSKKIFNLYEKQIYLLAKKINKNFEN